MLHNHCSKYSPTAVYLDGSIQLCKKFRSLPIGPFIKILHINRNHWVTVSNIGSNETWHKDTVYIYDSSGTPSISPSTVRMICSFFKPLASIHSVRFQIMNVKIQTNSNDCGLYVIVSATQLALGGADPVKYNGMYCVCDNTY